MNRALQFLILISVLIISFSHNSEAQKRSNRDIDEYFDDRGSFKDRLWYGADVTLNFFSVPGGNAFNAGIAPMVGYKITDAFSVGPRIEILYRGERYDINTGTDLKFNSTNYGVGAFTRLKVFNQYFIHAEYQTLNNEEGYDIDYVNNKVLTLRSWDDHFFIGGGYGASGGGIGFQISILWDVLQEFSSTNLPIQYRMGINYKF
ncbi:MAG: hypothetical protein P8M17_10500 [Saprospiraceae bacterium]|nr:hypothetical protein [Saprospiraceae bacterium]MDG2419412.1 hypothetical protein [Saprospiraceae bacterium]